MMDGAAERGIYLLSLGYFPGKAGKNGRGGSGPGDRRIARVGRGRFRLFFLEEAFFSRSHAPVKTSILNSSGWAVCFFRFPGLPVILGGQAKRLAELAVEIAGVVISHGGDDV